MEWFALSYWLIFGSLSGNFNQVDSVGAEAVYDIPSGTFDAELGFRAIFFQHVYVAASVATWLQKAPDGAPLYAFDPSESSYTTDIGFMWGPVSLGWSHECDHPVLRSSLQRDPWPSYGNTTNLVYVKFEGKVK